MRRTRLLGVAGAVVLTALLALYVWLVVLRAVGLLRSGSAVGVLLGLALCVLPVMVVAFLAKEWRLALTTQAMADQLAAEDGLPVDDLPRSPGGRIDRAAARVAFDAARDEAQSSPDDWRSWYRLAFAYDAAGDRSRARESLRTAARLRSRPPTATR